MPPGSERDAGAQAAADRARRHLRGVVYRRAADRARARRPGNPGGRDLRRCGGARRDVRTAARSRRTSPPGLEDRGRLRDERAAHHRRHRVRARECRRTAARAEGRPFCGQLPAAAQLRRRPGARRCYDARGRDVSRGPGERVVLLAAGRTGQARPAQAGDRAAWPARGAGRVGGRDHTAGSPCSASLAPGASATASPAASAPAAPGGSPRHPRPASRSHK